MGRNKALKVGLIFDEFDNILLQHVVGGANFIVVSTSLLTDIADGRYLSGKVQKCNTHAKLP